MRLCFLNMLQWLPCPLKLSPASITVFTRPLVIWHLLTFSASFLVISHPSFDLLTPFSTPNRQAILSSPSLSLSPLMYSICCTICPEHSYSPFSSWLTATHPSNLSPTSLPLGGFPRQITLSSPSPPPRCYLPSPWVLFSLTLTTLHCNGLFIVSFPVWTNIMAGLL